MLAPLVRKRAATPAHEAVAAHREDHSGELFGINQLCQEFGISLRTIAFFACSVPLRIASATSFALPNPQPTYPRRLPTTINALK